MRLLVYLVVLAGAGALPQPAESSRLDLPAELQQLLDGGGWDGAPAEFRVIILSHLADGCAGQGLAHPARHDAAVACVDQALARARALRKGPLAQVPDALFLEHLNLIYGARDRLGACADAAAHLALTRQVVAMSLGDPTGLAPSYGHLPDRWPADQSALLASVARYDAGHGTALLKPPLDAFRATLSRKGMQPGGLPRSEVTGVRASSKYPRGCAQSFISRYLAEADPALASTWWSAYRKSYLTRLGTVVGFREWPPGVDLSGDADSGPIVLGIGVSASALAIAAARAQGDEALATQLEASADAVGLLAGPLVRMQLPQAIRFQARWQPVLPLPATRASRFGRGPG